VGVGAPLVRWGASIIPLLHKNPEEVFLLVPAYPGGPGPKAVKRLLLLFSRSLITSIKFAVRKRKPNTTLIII